MTRRASLGCAALLAGCAALGACADILGIDDGKTRQYDASVADSAVDAGRDVAPDAPVDAAVDVPVSPLACGTTSCNALVEACCRTGDPADASAESFACVAADAGCAGLRVVCDGPSDCASLGKAGDECCAIVPDGGSRATTTACVAPGACGGAVVCTTGDDESCDLDAGQTCQPSVATILGYSICK